MLNVKSFEILYQEIDYLTINLFLDTILLIKAFKPTAVGKSGAVLYPSAA